MSACTSFWASCSRSDKSTPQKLSCSSTDSTPACISFGATCRVQVIRNFAFFDPRCKLMIIPGCKGIRRAPSRAPVWVMSIVCARRVTSSIETLTGKTIFLRGDLRLFSIDNHYRLTTSPRKVTGVCSTPDTDFCCGTRTGGYIASRIDNRPFPGISRQAADKQMWA